jgi:probable F420-dependent oxidoreductase
VKVLPTLPQADLNQIPGAARAAEAAGFDAIATMENRHDPFLSLGVAAVNTSDITLTTAVAIAFPRSPMVVANTAWDLQAASKGRFVLGLGPQIKPHNEKRFSVKWSPPAPRSREYVQALRAIWRAWELGEKLRFEGEHYTFTLMTPNFTPPSAGQPSVPVTLAAVGPHTLRLSGEVADGVRLHPFCTRAYLEDVVLGHIREGLEKSGKPRKHFEIAGGGFVATGATDEEVAKTVEWIRYRIAFYGSTPSYWPVFEHHDLGDLG